MNKELYEKLNYLNESHSKQEIEDKLINESEDLFTHLLKLYFWRDVPSRNYWKKEISGMYPSISKQSPKNKYPKDDFIEQSIWEKWSTDKSLNWIIRKIMNDEKYKNYAKLYPINEITPEAKGFCRLYIRWLSEILSKKGHHESSESIEMLDQLLMMPDYELKRYC